MTAGGGQTGARVLLVDDDPVLLRVVGGVLSQAGYLLSSARAAEDAWLTVQREEIDVVLTDLQLEGESGLELCRRVGRDFPDLPVILVTGASRLESAVAALRAGAYDFVTKPVEPESLLLAVGRAAEHRRVVREVARLKTPPPPDAGLDDLQGDSPAMRDVYDLIARVAETDATVLVTGESGTGKELAAHALHQRSARRAGPFVAVNCAALTETLLESELFGHAKGAFTDAARAHTGLFARANAGTLFLDEIGDMPLTTQVKVLRALQERKVRPVGTTDEVPFDVRLISATHQDLEAMVEEGRFRRDLYFRVDVVRLEMPPLRAREGDVLLLARRLLDRQAARMNKPVTEISPAAAAALLAYDWPGNVRELVNCIEHAVALCRLSHLTFEDLPEKIRRRAGASRAPAATPRDGGPPITLAEVERQHVLAVLAACQGNRAQAARALGLDRTTLYRKLQRYGVPLREGEKSLQAGESLCMRSGSGDLLHHETQETYARVDGCIGIVYDGLACRRAGREGGHGHGHQGRDDRRDGDHDRQDGRPRQGRGSEGRGRAGPLARPAGRRRKLEGPGLHGRGEVPPAPRREPGEAGVRLQLRPRRRR